jgi:hypothetical protein
MIHCHLLGHEENDMMRPMAVGVALVAPTAISATKLPSGGVTVRWTDNSINETGFKVQRFDLTTGTWITVGTKTQTPPGWNATTQTVTDPSLTVGNTYFIDVDKTSGLAAGNYQYRVIAVDSIGMSSRNQGTFPSVESKSDPSNIVYVTI